MKFVNDPDISVKIEPMKHRVRWQDSLITVLPFFIFVNYTSDRVLDRVLTENRQRIYRIY